MTVPSSFQSKQTLRASSWFVSLGFFFFFVIARTKKLPCWRLWRNYCCASLMGTRAPISYSPFCETPKMEVLRHLLSRQVVCWFILRWAGPWRKCSARQRQDSSGKHLPEEKSISASSWVTFQADFLREVSFIMLCLINPEKVSSMQCSVR